MDPISRAHSLRLERAGLDPHQHPGVEHLPDEEPAQAGQHDARHEPEDGLERVLVRPVVGGWGLLHEPEGPRGQGRHPERQPDRPPRRPPAVDLGEDVADHVDQREQEGAAVGDQRPGGDQLRRTDVGDEQEAHEDRHHRGVVPGGERIGRSGPRGHPGVGGLPLRAWNHRGWPRRAWGARCSWSRIEPPPRRAPQTVRIVPGLLAAPRDRVGSQGTRSTRTRRDQGGNPGAPRGSPRLVGTTLARVTRTLYALGRWCAERGVLVLVVWLALLGGVRFADRTLPASGAGSLRPGRHRQCVGADPAQPGLPRGRDRTGPPGGRRRGGPRIRVRAPRR